MNAYDIFMLTRPELEESLEPVEAAELEEPAVAALAAPPVTRIATSEHSSGAAARLLEIAANNADQLVTEARAEAASMRSTARAEADQLVMAAKMEAARVRFDLEGTRSGQEAEVARLRHLEDDHKDRLRTHLTGLLAQMVV